MSTHRISGRRIAAVVATAGTLAFTLVGTASADPIDHRHCVAKVNLPPDRTGDPAASVRRGELLRLHLLCRHYQTVTAPVAAPASSAPQVTETSVLPDAPMPTVVEGGPTVAH